MTQIAPRPELALPSGVDYAENDDVGQVASDVAQPWGSMDLGAITDYKFDLLASPNTSPDLLSAVSARQRELMSGSGPLTVVKASDSSNEIVFRGGTTLDREKARSSVTGNRQSSTISEEGPRTIASHYEKQLGQAEVELENIVEQGRQRLALTKVEAEKVRSDAAQEAGALLEPVEEIASARLAQAKEEAGRVKEDGIRRADRVPLVARDQLSVNVPLLLQKTSNGIEVERFAEVDYSLLERDEPPALPLHFMQQLVTDSGEEYLEGAKRHAHQLRISARTQAIDIEADALAKNDEEMEPVREQADAIIARADRLANEMVAEVEQEVNAAIAMARRRVEHLQSELELRRQKELAAQKERAARPTALKKVEPAETNQTSPIQDTAASSQLTSINPEATDQQTIGVQPSIPRDAIRRPASDRRKNKWVPAALVASIGMATIAVLVPHGPDNGPRAGSAIERLATDDAQVPGWFPGKAWEQELAKAMLDPRVTDNTGHHNYILGNPKEHEPGLGSIPQLLMFLGSMDNEHNQTGLVPMDTASANDIAKKLHINYVVESLDGKVRATPKTAYDTLLITVVKSNEILGDMFKNPVDKKNYYANPSKLLEEFAKRWRINDANGKPVPLPADFQQAFTAIGVDMLQGAAKSPTLEKLIQDPARQKLLQSITSLLKKEGVLTPDEEKSTVKSGS